MPFHDPFPDKLDHLLSCARIVSPLIPEIEAVPLQVAVMQREIEGLQAQIKFTEQSLESEQKSFDAERRRDLDARRHDWLVSDQEERDLASALADVKAKLRSMQDEIAARREEFEALAKQVNRMERYHPTYPTS